VVVVTVDEPADKPVGGVLDELRGVTAIREARIVRV